MTLPPAAAAALSRSSSATGARARSDEEDSVAYHTPQSHHRHRPQQRLDHYPTLQPQQPSQHPRLSHSSPRPRRLHDGESDEALSGSNLQQQQQQQEDVATGDGAVISLARQLLLLQKVHGATALRRLSFRRVVQRLELGMGTLHIEPGRGAATAAPPAPMSEPPSSVAAAAWNAIAGGMLPQLAAGAPHPGRHARAALL
eukprot:scaffold2220_cov377-Prasinococcus_capsulatus_cf.AAC.16